MPQVESAPVYDDSRSTIFIARDAGSVKKSVWTYRRSSVVREGVDLGEVRFLKISDADNCADMFTKPVDHAKYCHLLSRTHTFAPQAKRREPMEVEGGKGSLTEISGGPRWPPTNPSDRHVCRETQALFLGSRGANTTLKVPWMK